MLKLSGIIHLRHYNSRHVHNNKFSNMIVCCKTSLLAVAAPSIFKITKDFVCLNRIRPLSLISRFPGFYFNCDILSSGIKNENWKRLVYIVFHWDCPLWRPLAHINDTNLYMNFGAPPTAFGIPALPHLMSFLGSVGLLQVHPKNTLPH